MTTIEWWDALPACTDGHRYTEVLLAEDLGTKPERKRLLKKCLACPTYLDCLEDVIAAGKAWEFNEIHHELAKPPAPDDTEGPVATTVGVGGTPII